MTEFELISTFIHAERGRRAVIGQALGLPAREMATEEGVKRQYRALKGAGRLAELEQKLNEMK
jgi:hypothetical protein